MTKKKVTDRNTKAEIIEAYEELRKEATALESEVKKLNANPPQKAPSAAPVPPVEVVKTKEVKPMTNHDRIAQTLESLEKIQIGFGGAVSNLSEQLIAEASQFESVRERANEAIQKLEELHELEEIDETTLETLIQSYNESSKTFEEELAERQETLGQQLQDLKKAWRKEQDIYQRQLKERNETNFKQRQREAEEYQYNLELKRALDEEKHEEEKKQRYQQLEEARQVLEKQWTERENSISEQEKKYAETKQKVEAFKEELEKNIKNGKENGRNIGSYNAKVKSELRAKEVEGEKRNYDLRIDSLEQTIQNQEARLQSLSKQLDAALKQVQDLAVKAIEGSSNRNSFEAMKEIAIEQAKNQPKNKS
ncbi:hypothetical protein [Oscillatoria sp. FACHB-1406]|uniref:hypothetical protein n=1 Tax=Oscillatoria sp. FACHB-1406 TaxID=2692846 RepID=UPI001683C2D8|nr:hypothetical protein [Oscillatoria sp. FACHB-1406]MBD2578272.1 hypothetical protein [Oscillatoria sp. FACHB-1406]